MRKLEILVILLAIIGGMSNSSVFAQGPEKITPQLLSRANDGRTTEFFIIMDQQADLSGADKLRGKAKAQYVYRQLWDTAQASQKSLTDWLDGEKVPYRAFYIVNALLVEGDETLISQLAARPDVIRLEANPRFRNLPAPVLLPNVSQYVKQQAIEPGLIYVNADDVWTMGITGQGIVIGGQDTGYEWDHPALKNQYRGWKDGVVSHDYNWHDSIHETLRSSDCGVDSLAPCDDHNHGTHTLGTALGNDGAENQIGMAPDATWIGCRNMDEGWGTPASYLECFEFFLAPYPVNGTPADGDPLRSPDVTINSWGCPPIEGCNWDTLKMAVEAQRAAGIMTIVSAGNNGPNCGTVHTPPGLYDAAYTVGALVNGTDNLASFSSRGPVSFGGNTWGKPDLAAPGTEIRSSIRGGGYQAFQGTSMAAPHVSGAVALLWSAVPELINEIDATEAYLNNYAAPIETTECSSNGVPNNLYGHGRLNIKASIDAALADFPQPPTAAFTYTVPILANLPTGFTNLSTSTVPLTSTWDFGDGTIQTMTNGSLNFVYHAYTLTGSYTVTLTATNIYGTDSIEQVVFVDQGFFLYLPLLHK